MKIYIFLLSLLITLSSYSQVATYSFASRDGNDLKLDIYTPKNVRPDSLCVVYIFGGGFVKGARNDKYSVDYCTKLADKGFTAVAIDYRLGIKEVDFDTVKGLKKTISIFENAIRMAVEDCSSAIAYLCNNGFRMDKIILVGSSAGAITAVQTDYCRANQSQWTKELPKSSCFAGIVSYSGAIFSREARPDYLTNPSPTLFLHGMKDRIVTYNKIQFFKLGLFGGKSLAKRFDKDGYPYAIIRYKKLGHEVASFMSRTIPDLEWFVYNYIDSNKLSVSDTYRSDSEVKTTKWSKLTVFSLYNKK